MRRERKTYRPTQRLLLAIAPPTKTPLLQNAYWAARKSQIFSRRSFVDLDVSLAMLASSALWRDRDVHAKLREDAGHVYFSEFIDTCESYGDVLRGLLGKKVDKSQTAGGWLTRRKYLKDRLLGEYQTCNPHSPGVGHTEDSIDELLGVLDGQILGVKARRDLRQPVRKAIYDPRVHARMLMEHTHKAPEDILRWERDGNRDQEMYNAGLLKVLPELITDFDYMRFRGQKVWKAIATQTRKHLARWPIKKLPVKESVTPRRKAPKCYTHADYASRD
ncbi:MAG: hypothetical protein ACE5FT_02540 [Candidatus Nanoarchaeia archaeon]